MTKIIKSEGLFRPSKNPIVDIPLGVRSVGVHHVNKGWQDIEKTTFYIKLLWGIAGKGEIIIKGNKHILSPGTILLLFPDNLDNALALTDSWKFRWLTLDGEMNTGIVEGFALSEGIKQAGLCPEDLFVKLEREIKDVTPFGQRMASATAYTILSRAASNPYNKNKRNDLMIRDSIKFIRENFHRHDLNINYIAKHLKINRSTLSREFQKRKGVSIINFLISVRIQSAISFLKETNLSVSEIAFKTGYEDADYFTKSIKKHIGCTPTQCRDL